MSTKLTAQHYHDLAAARGFTWLGEVIPSSAHRITLWRCGQGHEFSITYHDVIRGRGCRACAIEGRANKTRKQVEDYHKLANSKGWQWLGETVVNSATLTTWRCEHGHTFAMRYSNARTQGCPVCRDITRGDRIRLKASDYLALAAQRNRQWMEDVVPQDSLTPTLWRCANGHLFKQRYQDARVKDCPYCNRERLSEHFRHKESDYHTLAENCELQWIGDTRPKNSKEGTIWRCANGH
jgi:hypothetical protein